MTHVITYNGYTIPLQGKSFTETQTALSSGLVDRSFSCTFDLQGTSESDLATKIAAAETALLQINKDLKVTVGGTDIIDWQYGTIGKPITTSFALDARKKTAWTRSATFTASVQSEGGGAVTPLIASSTQGQYNSVGLLTITESRTEKVDRTLDTFVDGETHVKDWIATNPTPSGFEILSTPTFSMENIKNRITFSVSYSEIRIARPDIAGIKEYKYNISVRWRNGIISGSWYQYQINGSLKIDKTDRTSHPIDSTTAKQAPDITTRTQQKVIEDKIWDAWKAWFGLQVTYFSTKDMQWDVGERTCSFTYTGMRYEVKGKKANAQFLSLDVSRSESTELKLTVVPIGEKNYLRKTAPEIMRVTISASGQVLGLIPSMETITKIVGGVNKLTLMSKSENFSAAKYIAEEQQAQQFSVNYQFVNLNNEPAGRTAAAPIGGSYQNLSRA